MSGKRAKTSSRARSRFALQRQREVSTDEFGQPVYVWETIHYLHGRLELLSGSETATGSVQTEAIARYRLTTSYHQERMPRPEMRLQNSYDTYEVVAVGDKVGDSKQISLQLRRLE